MKLRFYKFNFIVACTILLLAIMDINLFYLLEIPQPLSYIWSTYNKTLLVIITVFLFLWTRGFYNSDAFMKQYAIISCVSVIIVSVISVLSYSENAIHNVLMECSQYFLVFLAFPLLKLIRKEKGYDRILTAINVVTLVLYMVYIVQSIVYARNGVLFLSISENIRNDSLRMSLKSFGNVMIIYNFCRVWCDSNYKHKIFSVIQLILGVYCLFCVQQTRAYYFVIAVSIIAVMLFANSSVSKRIRNIFLVLLFGVILFSSGVFGQFIDSFGENGNEYGNTLVRIGAIQYFWKEFVQSPIWGHGIIATAQHEAIKTGPFGKYFYADVGFVGFLAQFGIFSFVIYIWPIIRWGKHILRCLKNVRLDPFLIGLYVYMLASTPTLLCVNQALYLIWPFSLALFTYSKELMERERTD